MFEEGENTAKTKTLGSVDVSKLEGLPEWKAFVAKAEVADKAKKAHKAAKDAMRDLFRKKLKQSADTVIEFSRIGDTVTVVEVLEKKQPKRAKASDMSSLF